MKALLVGYPVQLIAAFNDSCVSQRLPIDLTECKGVFICSTLTASLTQRFEMTFW